MPRIPDTLGAAPVPTAPTSVASYQPNNTGLANLGQSLANAGDMLQQEILKEHARINTAKVEDAFNQLRNGQIDLTIGQDNGFQNIRGADAVKQPLLKNYTDRFSDLQKQLAGSLDNDQQRDMFKARANVAQTQFTQDLLQHLYKENGVYQGQVYEGTVGTELRAASAKWDSPAEVQASLARISAATNDQASRLGLPDEAKNELLLQEQSKVHAAVIQQALASKKYDYAKAWFDANRDQVDTKTAKLLEQEVGNAAQKQLFDGYQSAYLQGMDSPQALNGLLKQVNADKTLDEDRRNILVGRIQNRSDVLENRAARAQDQRDHMLGQQIGVATAMVEKGYDLSPDQLAPLVTATQGTALAPAVGQLIQTSNATRQFRNMDFRSQEAYLSQMDAAVRKDPGKYDVTLVAKLKQIHDHQKEEAYADPMTFAVRQGFVDPKDPAVQPLNFSDPSQLAPQLAARFGLARTMAGKYGTPTKPLTTEETASLSSALTNASPQAKRQVFATLSKASGQDFDGYKAMMAQLAPGDPVTATAGVFAGRGYTDPTGGPQSNVADMILRGQSILHPQSADGSSGKGKLWPMPQGKDEGTMRTLFTSSVGDAFAGMPAAQNAAYQTAQAIYAAKVSDKGDSSGMLDPDAWKSAIKLATGGVERHNGHSVVLPWGMPYRDFRNQLDTRLQQVASSGALADGVTTSQLGDMPLLPIGDGRYLLKAGDGVMVDKNNQPVTIDFNKPLPPTAKKPPANFNALMNIRPGHE
jgi:hypothetical protein